jgi:hypothetical protein
MEEFFRIVEIVKKNVVSIRDATKLIQEIIQEFTIATTEAQEENASQGLQQIIHNGNRSAQTAQGMIRYDHILI